MALTQNVLLDQKNTICQRMPWASLAEHVGCITLSSHFCRCWQPQPEFFQIIQAPRDFSATSVGWLGYIYKDSSIPHLFLCWLRFGHHHFKLAQLQYPGWNWQLVTWGSWREELEHQKKVNRRPYWIKDSSIPHLFLCWLRRQSGKRRFPEGGAFQQHQLKSQLLPVHVHCCLLGAHHKQG